MKEKYQPTIKEEIRAENMMTPEQKNSSKEREIKLAEKSALEIDEYCVDLYRSEKKNEENPIIPWTVFFEPYLGELHPVREDFGIIPRLFINKYPELVIELREILKEIHAEVGEIRGIEAEIEKRKENVIRNVKEKMPEWYREFRARQLPG